MRSGWPICYTSADSVFQIAAHEETFGLDRLLELCRAIAPRLHEMKVGRVIARPFVGSPEAGFTRTTNRRDYAITPPRPVLTNWVQEAGRRVYGIGKIGDIFSMQGIDEVRKGSDEALMGHLSDLVDEAEEGSLTFANFVEFDSLYGHRRNVSGYARALEWFDAAIGPVLERLRRGAEPSTPASVCRCWSRGPGRAGWGRWPLPTWPPAWRRTLGFRGRDRGGVSSRTAPGSDLFSPLHLASRAGLAAKDENPATPEPAACPSI